MLSAVMRVGDIGVGQCTAHRSPKPTTVIFVTGVDTFTSEGSAITTVGSIGITTCGHTAMAIGSSVMTTAPNNQLVHRVSDVGIILEGGSFVSASGSTLTFTE